MRARQPRAALRASPLRALGIDPTSTVGVSRALTFAYDIASNRTRVTWPDSTAQNPQFVQYTYDAMNRVDLVQENAVTTLADYHYDALSRRASVTRGNGSVSLYGYDLASRLTGLIHDLPGGAINDQNFGFDYTPASQMASRSASNDNYNWVGATIANRSYARNGLNQYTNVGGTAFTYDLRGNLTNDGSRAFAYDLENRLTSVNGAAFGLSYDPLGRLRQTVGTTTTDFLYDSDRLVAEYDGAGLLLRRYVHGPGVDEPLVWHQCATPSTCANDRRYLITNHQGSVIAENGASTVRYAYGPYGEPDTWTGSRFRYTGQIALPEVQLYHYKARVYDPVLGRFLQTDPVGYSAGDLNLYTYVGNDPLNRSDPTGLQSCPTRDCPDVPLPPTNVRNEIAQAVGPARRGGSERGGHTIENRQTGERRTVTGRAAGRRDSGEFRHTIRRNPSTERVAIVSHTHNRSQARGTQGSSETRGQNAPSRDDQSAMDQVGAPIQTISPSVTTTLYRVGGQDRLAVDSGDRSRIPDLSSQDIIVDPEPQQ